MPTFTAVLAVLRQGREPAELKLLAERAAATAREAGLAVRGQRVGVPGISAEGLTAVLDFHVDGQSAAAVQPTLEALAAALSGLGLVAETGGWTVVDPDQPA